MIKIDIKKPLYGIEDNMILDINIEIKSGSFVGLMGDSGSGKSTFLRILAGLEKATGTIEVDGQKWLSQNIDIKPQKRDIGFVFQDYALFDNMTLLDNLLYVKKDKIFADKLLSMTKLDRLKDRLPHRLSGGQKQRVALCRAMMNRPKLLLLDEPLSAIDQKLRLNLQNDILTLHKEFQTTTIFTSHDIDEIYKLSDRVILLDKGEIIKDGKKDVLIEKRLNIKDIKKIDNRYIGTININGVLSEVEIDII